MKFKKALALIGIVILILFSCLKTKSDIFQTPNTTYYKVGVVSQDGSIEYSPIKHNKTQKIEQNCNCLNFQSITTDTSTISWFDCNGRFQQHIMSQYEHFTICGNNPQVKSDKVLVSFTDSCCSILPITFKDFCIIFVGNKTKLVWVVENEDLVNNYLVYKSDDSKNWEVLKSIPKKNGKGIYEYIDEQ